MASVGEKIRAARQLRGLTQADLSGDQVSTSMISQIEMNKTKPSLPLLQWIAKRLGLPVEHFVDDLEDEFAPDLQLAKANYHLLLNQTEQALEALAPDAAVFDARYTRYKETLVRALLQAKQHNRCIEVLEELREYALFSQDTDTLLTVHYLSGYLEYDTHHVHAAIHEWERTLTTGEKLLPNNPHLEQRIQYILMDTCFCLYHAHMQLHEPDRASAHLRRASRYGEAWSTLRTFSESLFESAIESLKHSLSRKSLELIECAVTALKIGVGLNKFSQVQSAVAAEAGTDTYDPWRHAMIAFGSAQPKAAFEAEITYTRQLLDSGDSEQACRRISESLKLLTSFQLSPHEDIPVRYALNLVLSQAHYASNRVTDALETLQSALAQAEAVVPLDELLFGHSLLLRWLRATGDYETGREVIMQIMARLESEEDKNSIHIME